jgi:type IV pilus assembly protein PilW
VCQVQQGDVILVSDCQNADIHAVSNVVNGAGSFVNITHGGNKNISPQLSNSYGPGSGIYKMTAMVYYIGYGASGEPALFRRRLTGQNLVPEELLESVYDMEILYGLNTDADNVANRYVTADNVANWEDVLTASVTLFTRSLDDGLTQDPVTYTFNGANVTDNRLLRDFSFTTTIRNRQP